jgi:two-component system, NtrC family, sensor kinase
VIAIENARLLESEQRRSGELTEALQQQTATADVLKVISRSAFDLQTVLDTLASSAAALCGASNGLIYLQSGDTFEVKAATKNWNPETFRLLSETPHRPGRRTVGARVLLTGEVQNVADMQADPDYDPAIRSLSASRALLGVPLKRGDAIIGAFVLSRREAGAYSQRQIEIVRTFADQAVIAIENARLFNETQQALERQTATADILKVIAGSPSDVRPVFQAIATSANKLIRGFSTAVFRVFGDAIHLAAFTPTSPNADEALKARFPSSVAQFPPFELVRGGVSAQIADTELDAGIRDLARLRGYRSMVFTPLMSGGAVIGIISVRALSRACSPPTRCS